MLRRKKVLLELVKPINNEKGATLILLTLVALFIIGIIIFISISLGFSSSQSENKLIMSDTANYLAEFAKDHAIWQIHLNLIEQERDETYPLDTKFPITQAVKLEKGVGGYTVRIINEEKSIENGELVGINYTLESDAFYYLNNKKNILSSKKINPDGSKVIIFNYYIPKPYVKVVAP